jgi:hypothetical protein
MPCLRCVGVISTTPGNVLLWRWSWLSDWRGACFNAAGAAAHCRLQLQPPATLNVLHDWLSWCTMVCAVWSSLRTCCVVQRQISLWAAHVLQLHAVVCFQVTRSVRTCAITWLRLLTLLLCWGHPVNCLARIVVHECLAAAVASPRK